MAPMMISTSEVIRNSFSDHHSRSKAQVCLKKIMDIIISSSSSDYYSSSSSTSKSKNTRVTRGIDIDLNLRLGLPSEESEEEMKGLSACSGVGDEGIKVIGDDDCNSTSSVVSGGECDDEMSRGNLKGKKVAAIDEQESSEITNLPIRSSEVVVVVAAGEQSETKSDKEDEEFQRKEYKNEGGYLGLLIEAAKLISGDFEENEEKGNGEKRKIRVDLEEKTGNESWMLDLYDGFEDISPIVKSKRGRNQVLPFRYRDSVLDPWKRISRQRSSKNQLHSCKQDLH